jgi:hypothetical protein
MVQLRTIEGLLPIPNSRRRSSSHNYGACETAQEGGYINTGTFSTALLTDYPLYLQLYRDSKNEKYFIHYLKVE